MSAVVDDMGSLLVRRASRSEPALRVRVAHGRCIAVLIIARPGQLVRTIAYATAGLDSTRLSHDPPGWSLWLAHAAFDVTDAEAARIREAFAPLGLRIIERAP